jgi:2-methylcitrate dehydratase PrpD
MAMRLWSASTDRNNLLKGTVKMGTNEEKKGPRGKVVCTGDSCYWVSEDELKAPPAPVQMKKEKKEDASCLYAKMVPTLHYEDVPSEAVEAVKMDILDTLAVTLAGSTAEGTRELLDQVRFWGGREESSVLIHGGKVPSPEAALINGQMAHARDYDDIYHIARIHVGAVNVPTGLAMAEKVGEVSGKELITAILMGIDIELRLAQAATLWTQFHPTGTFGYFGSCAVAGRLLGLNEDQMLNAFGIAYSQASGNKQCMHDGSLTKRLQPGLAARGGILAAHLAQRGYTGTTNNLEGKAGLFALYHAGQYDPEPLTKDLGRHFDITRLGYKPYPCAV